MLTCWMSRLAPYDVREVVAVLEELADTQKFPPALSEIVQPLKSQAKERERLSEYDDPTRYVTIPRELLPLLNEQSLEEMDLPIDERIALARRQLQAVAS